ncbi:hypothetical protein HDU98_009125 [Podochytrium sp. JEL0797]|nr:hypothetical protein HDU98_009125 [Podochytrium sp. JEL0797]
MSNRRLSQQELELLVTPQPRKLSSAAVVHVVGSVRDSKTVWDEDDLEALKVAQTIAEHAPTLFPTRANAAAGVKGLIGQWERRTESPPPPARKAPTRQDIKHTHRLSIKQSAMLRKALRTLKPTDNDLSALASVIVGTTESDSSDDNDDRMNDDEERRLIDSYFASISMPEEAPSAAATQVASPTQTPTPAITPAPRRPPAPAVISLPSIPSPSKPANQSNRAFPPQPISSLPPKSFVDIHEAPQTPIEIEYQPPSLSTSRAMMNRRQTIQKVDSLRKRASIMPAGRLIRELDTVMSDIQMFGINEFDEEDGSSDESSEGQDDDEASSLRVGNGWDNDEDEVETLEESRKTPDSDPDLATQSSETTTRHPAHLVRHLDRMSLYTAANDDGAEEQRPSGMDSLHEDDEEEEELTSELTGLEELPRKTLTLSPTTIQVDAEKTRFASLLSSMNSNPTPTAPGLQTAPTQQIRTSTSSSGSKLRSGFSPFPSPPGSTTSKSSGHMSAYNQRIAPTLSPPPPRPDIPRPTSPSFFQRATSPSLFRSNSSMYPPSVSSPTPHQNTLSRAATLSHTSPAAGAAAGNTSLLNSEDDPDAISGQLRLHTNKMFNAWQDIVLVLSPRKRGLYYVKTGKGKGKTEQVVGFIELNAWTEVDAVGDDRSIANVFRGKPTFRVVKVMELEGGGGVRKEYFYFLAKENKDRDMWVDAMQGKRKDLEAEEVPKVFELLNIRFLSQEDLSLQLQKQQRLLAQQKALMAAVAAQLSLQQEITNDLQVAQQIQQRRMSTQTGGSSNNGSNNTPATASTNNASTEFSMNRLANDSGIGSSNNHSKGRRFSQSSSNHSGGAGAGGAAAARQFQHKELLHPLPEMTRSERNRLSFGTDFEVDAFDVQRRGSAPFVENEVGRAAEVSTESRIPMMRTRSDGAAMRAGSPLLGRGGTLGRNAVGGSFARSSSPMVGNREAMVSPTPSMREKRKMFPLFGRSRSNNPRLENW